MRRMRRKRGSSLIEVLIALAVMALLMVGILQMFSVALVVNQGAGARTVMLFKCQQVIENLRYYYSLANVNAATPDSVAGGPDPAGGPITGIPFPMPPTATPTVFNIPYNSTDALRWGYWGPAGANVMEEEDGPYRVQYSIMRDAARGIFIITVSAVPTDVAGASTRFMGIGLSRTVNGTLRNPKRVDYVAQF